MVAYFVWLVLAGHTTSQVAQIVPSLLINPVGLMTRSSVLLSATAVLSTFTSPVALAIAWPEAVLKREEKTVRRVILGDFRVYGVQPTVFVLTQKSFQFHLVPHSFLIIPHIHLFHFQFLTSRTFYLVLVIFKLNCIPYSLEFLLSSSCTLI